MNALLQIFLLVVGFLLLIKGADFFVDGSAGIAKRFGIPELVIGLTIVAMGTSAPEAAVSISAAFKGNADISIGNVIGSNIMNILVILGIASAIVKIAVSDSTIKYELPYMIFLSVLLPVLGLDGKISRIDGAILWICFIIYLGYLFMMAKKNKEEAPEEEKKLTLPKALLFTLLGLIMIVLGSNVTVDAASTLAKMFGMSERFIGLTVVAFGTSLPELVTSVTAAKKGNADIAIGNIVGSNVFNILFVLGTSALIIPINYAGTFMVDAIVAIAAAVILWLSVFKTKHLGRKAGLFMVACYAGYFVYLIMK